MTKQLIRVGIGYSPPTIQPCFARMPAPLDTHSALCQQPGFIAKAFQVWASALDKHDFRLQFVRYTKQPLSTPHILQQLANGTIDLAMNPMIENFERLQLVDFSTPVLFEKRSFVASASAAEPTAGSSAILRTLPQFGYSNLAALIGAILLLSAVIGIVNGSFAHNAWRAFLAFVGFDDFNASPVKALVANFKLLLSVWFFAVLVLRNLFAAKLTDNLILKQAIPFHDIPTLAYAISSKGFRFVTKASTNFYLEQARAADTEAQFRLLNASLELYPPIIISEHADLVRALRENPRYVFAHDTSVSEIMTAESNFALLSVDDEQSPLLPGAYALRKGLTRLRLAVNQIVELARAVMEREERARENHVLKDAGDDVTRRSVQICDIAEACFLLAGGLFVSTLVFLRERFLALSSAHGQF